MTVNEVQRYNSTAYSLALTQESAVLVQCLSRFLMRVRTHWQSPQQLFVPLRTLRLKVMDEQLDRLQDRHGHVSSVVRLVHCITGPRLRRQYFLGTDATVSLSSGYYLESSLLAFIINPQGTPYIPNKLEQYADSVITAVR